MPRPTRSPTRGTAPAVFDALQWRAIFRKQRGRFLQEEALALVQKGDTSVQEVLRVLKGPGGEAGGGAVPGQAA